jgi:hypothetical protein
MESYGVMVLRVQEVLVRDCDRDVRKRILLENLAMKSLRYTIDGGAGQYMSKTEEGLLSDKYKHSQIQNMSPETLAQVVLCRPTVTLGKSSFNTPLKVMTVSFRPMSNLVFTRDQQITTARGVVVGRLMAEQRAHEIEVMGVVLQKLGVPLLGHLRAPATLEGGDFFCMGPDICYIGVGLRTNQRAVQELLAKDWCGTPRVAVVEDIFDRDQARMHLDTVFNVVSDHLCLMLESIMGRENPRRRLVSEYVKNENGEWVVGDHQVEFSEFVRAEGFDIIAIPEEEQLNYGCNHINLGADRILAVNAVTARRIASHPKFKGTIEVVDISAITSMYGAARCSTQIMRRRARQWTPRERPQAANPQPWPKRRVDTTDWDQCTNTVFMVAPTAIEFNPETAADNAFMKDDHQDLDALRRACLAEFEGLHRSLQNAGVQTHVFTHEEHHGTPEACFPNNWFSTHGSGRWVLYPMATGSRRRERRQDFLSYLEAHYGPVSEDLSQHERSSLFLEGTGALVLDRAKRVAYVAISERANEQLVAEWSRRMGGWEVEAFQTRHTTPEGKSGPIYHTNVLMAIGSKVAVVCPDVIVDRGQAVLDRLRRTGRTVVEISPEQVAQFCGNILELKGTDDRSYMVMSTSARAAFRAEQLSAIEAADCTVLAVDVTSIQRLAGGGVRCMLAELF